MGNTVSIAAPTPSLAIAVGSALPAICTIAVAARLYNKRHLDGWLTLASLVLLWGQCIGLIYGVAQKALAYPDPPPPPGVDPEDWVSPETILSSKLFYTLIVIQIPCLTLVKLSFIFFYRRLFTSRVKRNFLTWYLDILAATLIAWGIAFFLSELFVCRTDWDVLIYGTNAEQAAECIPFTPWDDAFAATDFVLDLFVILTPIPLVPRLKLSRSQKWATLAVFSLGAFAIAASVTRFVFFVADDSVSFTVCLYWTCLESGIAVLASSLPSTFGLYTIMRRKAKETRERRKAIGSGSGLSSGGRTLVPNTEKYRLNSNASKMSEPPITDIYIEHGYAVNSSAIDMRSLHST